MFESACTAVRRIFNVQVSNVSDTLTPAVSFLMFEISTFRHRLTSRLGVKTKACQAKANDLGPNPNNKKKHDIKPIMRDAVQTDEV